MFIKAIYLNINNNQNQLHILLNKDIFWLKNLKLLDILISILQNCKRKYDMLIIRNCIQSLK